MSEQWVTKNHYNPCFWTAYWNPEYYAAAIRGDSPLPPARDQVVLSLNAKADKILTTTVENVHYDKGLGPAEISREAALEFCRRHFPDKYHELASASENADYPVFINFEDILSTLEGLPQYDYLRAVVARQNLASELDKGMLACVVYLQSMRSHAVMNSLLEFNETLGYRKFEFFLLLKRLLSDTRLLAQMIVPLAHSHWVLYKTSSSTFPLSDSPVLARPNSMMLALSPRLLLEIFPHRRALESQWQVKVGIKRGKLAEFRRRTIKNTFREIIFDDRETLEYWQRTPEFRDRVNHLRHAKHYNALVSSAGLKELWHINAFSDRP